MNKLIKKYEDEELSNLNFKEIQKKFREFSL